MNLATENTELGHRGHGEAEDCRAYSLLCAGFAVVHTVSLNLRMADRDFEMVPLCLIMASVYLAGAVYLHDRGLRIASVSSVSALRLGSVAKSEGGPSC